MKNDSVACKARVPSNIALLKYWGKADAEAQIPANDSLSMTLKHAYTETTSQVATQGDEDRFFFQGEAWLDNDPRLKKIKKQLSNLRQHLHGHPTPALHITSHNSFPMGCGMASSASGIGALTLSALSTWLDCSNFAELEAKGLSRQRLAHLARLGSGSAGRSFWGGYVHWEKVGDACCLSPLFSAEHWPLVDIVMIVSDQQKSVSSTQGHASAWTSPLFAARLASHHSRLHAAQSFLSTQNFAALGALIEQEALDMHAVMMSSTPPLHYFDQKTGTILAEIRQLRNAGQCPAFFTLDAGPNVHVLCEPKNQEMVRTALQKHFPDIELLIDETGAGPTLGTQPLVAHSGDGGRIHAVHNH